MQQLLKGITYAKQPEIGIPISENIISSRKSSKEDYIAATVYLGYRMLDGTYPNKEKYMGYLSNSTEYMNMLGTNSVNRYRWFLSLTLLRTYIDAIKENKRNIELLEKAYNHPIEYNDQISNYSKIGTLLYYHNQDKEFKDKLLTQIEKLKTPNLEEMSTNALDRIVLPLLNAQTEIEYSKVIKKYKNWHIYKDFIQTLALYKS
jgi:hypothetical protein